VAAGQWGGNGLVMDTDLEVSFRSAHVGLPLGRYPVGTGKNPSTLESITPCGSSWRVLEVNQIASTHAPRAPLV